MSCSFDRMRGRDAGAEFGDGRAVGAGRCSAVIGHACDGGATIASSGSSGC